MAENSPIAPTRKNKADLVIILIKVLKNYLKQRLSDRVVPYLYSQNLDFFITAYQLSKVCD